MYKAIAMPRRSEADVRLLACGHGRDPHSAGGASPPGKRHAAPQIDAPSCLDGVAGEARQNGAPCRRTGGRRGRTAGRPALDGAGHPETGPGTAGAARSRALRRRCGPGRRRSGDVLPGSRDGGRRRTDRADQRSPRTRCSATRRQELDGQSLETLLPERLRAAHAHTAAASSPTPGCDPWDYGLELTARRKDGTRVSRGDQPELRRERRRASWPSASSPTSRRAGTRSSDFTRSSW